MFFFRFLWFQTCVAVTGAVYSICCSIKRVLPRKVNEPPVIISGIVLYRSCEMHRLYHWVVLLIYGVAMPVAAQGCHLTEGWLAMDTTEIALKSGAGQYLMSVRVADDSSERAAGYQWVCAQDSINTAVLFVFPKTFYSAFHMRNVFVPLDIYFFDESGRQVGAMHMSAEPPGQGIKPHYYSPSAKFRYALEIPGSDSHDLKPVLPALSLLVDSLPGITGN